MMTEDEKKEYLENLPFMDKVKRRNHLKEIIERIEHIFVDVNDDESKNIHDELVMYIEYLENEFLSLYN